ncbi:MAG: hypothetical protein GKR90_19455 [Pseudomonadales bacterium]|nr:hypothetical protein [Pseudomonadales bacterium]
MTDLATNQSALRGAHNLLFNCLELNAGDHLLIVQENPDLGWYDREVVEFVSNVARDMSASVTLRNVEGPDNRYVSDDAATEDAQAIDSDFDCCLFFSRIGDQMRFDPKLKGSRRIMCYVRSMESLASSYGGIHYQALAELKAMIDRVLFGAQDIVLTCPLGTSLKGRVQGGVPAEDVTVRRFPLGVHTPLNAAEFSGEVRLARYLTTTGSRVYAPASIVINQPVTANISAGRIVGYAGDPNDLQQIHSQYANVSEKFEIDADSVLSWHAGLHPGCHFSGRATTDPDKWSNTVFTSPKFLHFHTCGNAPPGEICWMVLDPTISVDGVALWDSGRLYPERFPELCGCLSEWPELKSLYRGAYGSVGLV